MKNINLLICGLLLMTGGANAAVVEVVWDQANRFAYQGEIGAGKIVEICDTLSQGQEVQWQFSGSAALDFNIHYHADKAVVFPAKQDNVMKADGKLVVPVSQDYCWMWKNPAAAPVHVRVDLQK